MAGLDFKRPEQERETKETICDVQRDIYQYIKNNDKFNEDDRNFLFERIETAFSMGKSMDAKLRQYKFNYDDDWWNKKRRDWNWSELKD